MSRVVPDYESSCMVISARMRTGQRVGAVRHCVVILCAECRGDLIRKMEDPTVV